MFFKVVLNVSTYCGNLREKICRPKLSEKLNLVTLIPTYMHDRLAGMSNGKINRAIFSPSLLQTCSSAEIIVNLKQNEVDEKTFMYLPISSN